jgi:hypothetical protein
VVFAALVAALWLPLLDRLAAEEATWPPFLPHSGDKRSDDAVEQMWKKRTFERKLSPAPVGVPMDLYVALINAPEVVAAAANHLRMTAATLDLVADRTYEWRSPDGSRAMLRVLLSEPSQQVTLSQGQLAVHGLTIRGSVLGNLKLSSGKGGVHQELTTYVRIDNAILAWLTKALLPLMPKTIDAELSKGFEITGAVAGWAWQDREEFCRWQETSRFAPERVKSIADAARCPGTR